MTALDTTTWGPALRDARQAVGLTLSELAKLANASRQTVELVESGDHLPSDALKVRLGAALDVDPHQLFPLLQREYAA